MSWEQEIRALEAEASRASLARDTATLDGMWAENYAVNVVLVMGRDAVTDPPDGAVTRRRFTNIWQLVDGQWLAIGRHAG